MSLGVLVTGSVHMCQHSALLWVCVRLTINMAVYLHVGVSGPASVCLVCHPFCLCQWSVCRWRCGWVSSCRLQLGNPTK